MATKNTRFHLTAMIVAALGLGCAATRDDERQQAGGINYAVGATDETRDATGISAWTVVPVDDNTIAIAALDENNQQVANLVIRSTATEYTIDATGEINGRIAMTASGELIENTIDDVTILARFHEDGLLELDAAGFRTTGAECATGAAGAGLDCGQFVLNKNPMQLLKCGVSVVGAGLTCYDWWQGDGNQNGQEGGNQEGGNQEGGNQEDGGQDSNGQDEGGQEGGGYEDGGMEGGGYEDGGMEGGGYEDGGMEGGGYEDGGIEGGVYDGGYVEGGYDEGGNEGGYGEGGYGEGGYGEGGYGEGGYGGYGGEGGYGGGGYGYAPRSRQQMAPVPSTVEIPTEGSMFSFTSGGAANGPVPLSAWNLTMNKGKRAK